MKRTTRLAATALTAALALPTVAAAGDETVGSAAFNDDLSVTVVDGAVVVTGSATFGGEELLVGEDAALDGTGVPGAGSDLLSVTISQDPDSGTISFALDTDLVAPATAPGLLWAIPIGGSSLNAAQLMAFSTDSAGVPGSFQFGLATGGGVNEDFGIADVPGRVDGSTLIWEVDPATIGVDAGERIVAGEPAFASFGVRASGASLASASGLFDDMAQTEAFGVGGGATVKILDADGEVADQGTAKLRRGVFTRSVSGLAAGTYTVEVTTRYADAAVTESFTVTI